MQRALLAWPIKATPHIRDTLRANVYFHTSARQIQYIIAFFFNHFAHKAPIAIFVLIRNLVVKKHTLTLPYFYGY